MGELADIAKRKSDFFKLEKGESAVVKFLSYRKVPNYKDPKVDDVQYKFGTPYGDKYWTNGNSRIMLIFDALQPGDTVRITRGVFTSKEGVEDPNKSTYAVEIVPKEDPAAW